MNSRERMKLSLNHKEPDRIPIDLAGMRSSGISAIAYNNLMKELSIISSFPKMYDFMQQIVYPEKEIRDLFHIDTIDAGQAFLKDEKDWKEWVLNDGSKCLIPKYLIINIDEDKNVFIKDKRGLVVGIKPKDSLYVDQNYWVYGDLPKIPEIIKDEDLNKDLWSIPSPPWHLDIFNEIQLDIFTNKIKKLHSKTDYVIMIEPGFTFFQKGTFLRGMENFICDICLDTKGVERLFEKLMEKYLAFTNRILKNVGEYIDIIVFGDDLGMQTGPFIPPKIFKSLFKQRYKKLWNYIHSNSNCKVFLHSCGSIYELIPHLIEAGLDILNPIQTNTLNMEPEKIKKEFGKYITLWGGGCDTRNVLLNGSPSEVKEDVKSRIEILSKNGGYVFNQIHNILADIPPRNTIAMFEAAYEFGKY